MSQIDTNIRHSVDVVKATPDKDQAKAADEAKAAEEKKQPTVSQPGGFDNDPDDSANPNEVIERHRQKLRP